MAYAKQSFPLRNLFRFLMLLLIATYLGLLTYLWQNTLAKTRADLSYTNSFLVRAVRTTLKEHELILRGLGSALLEVGTLDYPENGRQLIERMKKIDPGMVGFGLAQPDGQLILVSGIPQDSALPNLLTSPATRNSFQDALNSDHLRTGRAYFFKPLADWVVPIRVTLRDDTGKAQAVMIAGYAIENATTAWSNVTLLPQVKVALVGNDGFVRYGSPLPPGPKQQVLQKLFGTQLDTSVLKQIAAIKSDKTFVEMYLPNSGGDNYVAYTRIPEYGLHAGAFITRSVVINHWLQSAAVPTALLFLILISGLLAYQRAVQQQTRANSEIQQLSAWQQAVLDGADYSIISTDTNGTIVSFNKTAQRMLGYTAAEMIGKTTMAKIHDPTEIEQRATELSKEMHKTIEPGFEVFVTKARHGQVEEREWNYIRKDGSRLPVRLSVTPLTTNDGLSIGFMGIAADLSEKKAIQAVLRDSEARYKILFERAGDAIFLMHNERFIDCNPATLDMFGCTRDQIVGQTPIRYSPEFQPDGRPSAEKAMEKINAAYTGTTQFFEWRHIKYDGTPFEAEVTLNVVDIADEPHLLATVRDISARKQNEDELTRSRQALIQHNESLRLINQLSQRLHVSLQIDDILHETIQVLLGLSYTPNVAIYLIKTDNDSVLHLAASHGFTRDLLELGQTLPLNGSLTGRALKEARVMETTEIANDDRLYPSVKNALAALGARSALALPLFYQNQPLGCINLIYDNVREFAQTEKETLVSLGNTVALAIANARHVENLAFLARHDSLTNLPNRILLHETVYNYLGKANKSKSHVALLLLDLDRFKEINDTLGHQIGDRVLSKVGERLAHFGTEFGALTSRLGGDEFAITLMHDEPTDSAIKLANNILNALHKPFEIEGIELSLGASIGVAFYPEHGSNSHALLRAADVAMYHAKKRSAGIMVYDSDFDDYSTERLTLANELVQAVHQQQLVLHYQPKIDLLSGEVIGFEALVRWQHPRLGLLYPEAFIHLAEMSEVIHPFTRAVIELAIKDKQQLHKLGYLQPVAINLSAINLSDMRCHNCLKNALENYQLPSAEIELEITETALMHEGDHALNLLRRFNEMGINIAIDDFGTGYSSLSYLRRLPIKALKIDQSFVKDMLINHQDSTIVRSTIDLAHNLELLVIAEGVENAEILSLLRSMGCDQAQGFGICHPQPFQQLVSWLSETLVQSELKNDLLSS
jgi:diguanylate cyclase (GGDEF)-like protein/PAS domain S-box-containing protein